MSLRPTHDLHTRRFGRNLGVGLVLAAFIVVVFALTMTIMPTRDPAAPPVAATGTAGGN